MSGDAQGRLAQSASPLARPWWGGLVSGLMFRVLWPARIHGREHVPAEGGCVFAANHIGILDGPLLVAVAPRWTSCLVKKEMFTGRVGWFLRAIDQIPIDRDGMDRTALTTAVSRLQAGGAIGVFPEGTRGRGDISDTRAGAAWLALRAGVPVVPVAILGTRRTGESASKPPRPRRLDVVFGPALNLARPDLSGRAALAAASAQLRDVLAAHVTEAVALTGQRLPEDEPPGARTASAAGSAQPAPHEGERA